MEGSGFRVRGWADRSFVKRLTAEVGGQKTEDRSGGVGKLRA